MTALPLRPALVDALCAISVCDPWMDDDELRRLVVAFIGPHWPFCAVSHRWESGPLSCDWITRDPAEAFETLISRGVLPDEWAVDERRAFVCPMCGGAKTVPAVVGGARVYCPGCTERCESCGGTGSVIITTGDGSHGTLEPATCDDCDAGHRSDTSTGFVAHPPTIPALVAWASLGPAAILRAEELARETVRRLRPWGAPQVERVVWHVRPLSEREDDGSGCAWGDDAHDGNHALESGGRSPAGDIIEQAHDVWDMGLVIASITADAVTVVVPMVGGAS